MNLSGQPQDVVLLVDVANVIGSRPDGWWRDRAAAATRLLYGLEPLNGAEVTVPAGLRTVRITQVRASLRVRPASSPPERVLIVEPGWLNRLLGR